MSVVSQSTDIGYTCTLSLFKGTVSVISSEPPCNLNLIERGSRSISESKSPLHVSYTQEMLFSETWKENKQFKYKYTKTWMNIFFPAVHVTFVEKPLKEIISFQNCKFWYPIHIGLDKDFKGTVVNRTLPSLHVKGHLNLRLRAFKIISYV